MGTSGYFSEVAEVKEHNALPGQEVEVRSRRSGQKNTLLKSRGLSTVFIVSLDMTLKPEDGSKDRAFNLMRSGKLRLLEDISF